MCDRRERNLRNPARAGMAIRILFTFEPILPNLSYEGDFPACCVRLGYNPTYVPTTARERTMRSDTSSRRPIGQGMSKELAEQTPRSLSEYRERSEEVEERGQVFPDLRRDSGPMQRKFGDIGAVPATSAVDHQLSEQSPREGHVMSVTSRWSFGPYSSFFGRSHILICSRPSALNTTRGTAQSSHTC